MAAPENTRNVCGKLRLISGHVAAGPRILHLPQRASRGLFSTTMSVWVDSATAARSDELAERDQHEAIAVMLEGIREDDRAAAGGDGAIDAAARRRAARRARVDPFAALGLAVGPECDDDALDLAAKRAFRRLALQYHPDKREGGKTLALAALHRAFERARRARARAPARAAAPRRRGGARGRARRRGGGARDRRRRARRGGGALARARESARRERVAARAAGAARDVRGRRPRERRAPRAPRSRARSCAAGERRTPSSARSARARSNGSGARGVPRGVRRARRRRRARGRRSRTRAWPRRSLGRAGEAPPLWSPRHVSETPGRARAPAR